MIERSALQRFADGVGVATIEVEVADILAQCVNWDTALSDRQA
jgi:hypothetical protein